MRKAFILQLAEHIVGEDAFPEVVSVAMRIQFPVMVIGFMFNLLQLLGCLLLIWAVRRNDKIKLF